MSPTGAPRRIAIVEDHARFRATMETFVRDVPGFVLARSYGRADAALRDLDEALGGRRRTSVGSATARL